MCHNHGPGDKHRTFTGASGDAGGRLQLVPGQHPDFDSGVAKQLKGFADTSLKPGRWKIVTSEKEFKFKDDSVVLDLSRIELKYEMCTNFSSNVHKLRFNTSKDNFNG